MGEGEVDGSDGRQLKSWVFEFSFLSFFLKGKRGQAIRVRVLNLWK